MRILLITLLLSFTTLFASIGKISAAKGDVKIDRESKLLKVVTGTALMKKDKLITGKDGRAQIVFDDKTVISIGKNSNFNIEDYFFDETKPSQSKALFGSSRGILKTITGKIGKLNPSKFSLKTKSASIGIRGTIYFVEAQPGKPEVYACTQGVITVQTPDGVVDVQAGYQVVVVAGEAPKVTPIPETKKQELEQNSGAKENEKESGQNAQTVEEAKSQTLTTTQKDEDDDGMFVASNDETDNTPPLETTEDATKNANDVATTTAQEEITEEFKSDSISYTGIFFPVFSGDAASKSATYDLFHISKLTNNYYDYYNGTYKDSQGEVTSRSTLTLSNGAISGDSTVYFYDSYGYPYEQTSGIQYSSTIDFNDITIPNPYSSYVGLGFYTEYETANSVGDETYMTNSLTIFSDSKEEFFVIDESSYEYTGLTDDTYGYSVSEDYDSEIYYYDNLYNESNKLIVGTKSTFASLPNDGVSLYVEPYDIFYISMYKNYINNELYNEEYYSSSYDSISDYRTYLIENNSYINYLNDYEFKKYMFSSNYITSNGTLVNWSNKNILSYNFNLTSSGIMNTEQDSYISIGQITEDTDGNAKVSINEYSTVPYSMETLSDSEVYIFGSEQQGLGGSLSFSTTENTHEDIVGQFRADGIEPESVTNKTGISTFNGFASSYSLENTLAQTNNLTIDLDRSNSLIVNINNEVNGLDVTSGGELGLESAYISDTSFATLGTTGTFAGNTIGDGYLLAIDTDMYQHNSYTVTDGISWGLWGVDSDNSLTNIDADFWVAGIDRVEDMISILGTNFTGSYVGNVMGVVTGDISGILDPIASTINLQIDFGVGTIDANLNAVTNIGETISSTKNFTSADFDSNKAVYSATDGTSSIQGSLYNNGATTAGVLNFIEGSNTINGVYKAAKQ